MTREQVREVVEYLRKKRNDNEAVSESVHIVRKEIPNGSNTHLEH